MRSRKSFWAWGLESDEPTMEAMHAEAERVSKRYGVALEAVPAPTLADLDLRPPRVKAAAIAGNITIGGSSSRLSRQKFGQFCYAEA